MQIAQDIPIEIRQVVVQDAPVGGAHIGQVKAQVGQVKAPI